MLGGFPLLNRSLGVVRNTAKRIAAVALALVFLIVGPYLFHFWGETELSASQLYAESGDVVGAEGIRAEQFGKPLNGVLQSATPTGRQTNPVIIPKLNSIDQLGIVDEGDSYSMEQAGDRYYFTMQPDLQRKAKEILQKYRVPWGALVAVEPKTGRVLAIASHSEREPLGRNVATRATFPAASLFKLITASAAVETAGMSSDREIYFRGGDYVLSKYNFLPNQKLDRRKMKLGEALGRSVNPVFARVALNNLSVDTLKRYARNYGFDQDLDLEIPVEISHFTVPLGDYETARTAAGFGDVRLSPLHAALITAAIANNGTMMKPYFIDRIYDSTGRMKYRSQGRPILTPIRQPTAHEVMKMMHMTVEKGTARKHFAPLKNSVFRGIDIAAKTGTLTGDDPKGRYHWFVASAPMVSPDIAIAALVIDSGGSAINGSGVGKELLKYFFSVKPEKKPA